MSDHAAIRAKLITNGSPYAPKTMRPHSHDLLEVAMRGYRFAIQVRLDFGNSVPVPIHRAFDAYVRRWVMMHSPSNSFYVNGRPSYDFSYWNWTLLVLTDDENLVFEMKVALDGLTYTMETEDA